MADLMGGRRVQEFDTFYAAVKLCGHRWTLEILTSLQQQPMRFTDLIQTIRPTPSAKSLNEALHRLQDRKLVGRTGGDEGGLYRLSPGGRQLLPLLLDFMQEIQRWAKRYQGSGDQVTGAGTSRRT
ncbi:winged helix-turn-helix transcriptional regulator [Salinispora pacifica]|uniref:winged helix-turn-helix transcriptional regulator n=1 Tax=Salinispora pacifica TaxID=351187 RepID=UPI00048013BD|nr:winged helix-turn-helix transcriptional regulator [Salinispora pacifica]